LTQATNTNLYAHMSIQADVQLKANGQPDDRYTAKIRTGLPSRQGPTANNLPTSAPSTLGYSIWPTQSSSIPIIRNEELILLRAEAKQGTGDKAGAIADLNIVRQNSGGLPASTLTPASSDDAVITAILYEKRYSLLMEGDRWMDMRRYGKLDLLPLDIPSGPNKNFVAKVMPVPQAECLNRLAMAAQFRGPSGLDDCAP
jgi:starch-binding outer membrane protein, SusD/RagB family